MSLASNSFCDSGVWRRLPSMSTWGSSAHGIRAIPRRSRTLRATITASPQLPSANSRPSRTGRRWHIAISASLAGRRSDRIHESVCGSVRGVIVWSSMIIRRRSPRRRNGIDGDSSISARGSSRSTSSICLPSSASWPPRPSTSVFWSIAAVAWKIRSVTRLSSCRDMDALFYRISLQVAAALAQEPLQAQKPDDEHEQAGPAPQLDVGPAVDADDPRRVEREARRQVIDRAERDSGGRARDRLERRGIADRAIELGAALADEEDVGGVDLAAADRRPAERPVHAGRQAAELVDRGAVLADLDRHGRD